MNLSLGTKFALVTLFHRRQVAGGSSCSNTLRRHLACLASVSVRKLAVVPFLARPKLTIPFLGLSKRKRLLRRLATHSSDKSLRLCGRIFVKIFVSSAEFCRRNKSHKVRLIWLLATCCCNKILLRRRRICGKRQNTSSPKNACVGGYLLLIPLKLIRNNRDWLCQKGTRGSPHRQSYDIRTPWYK